MMTLHKDRVGNSGGCLVSPFCPPSSRQIPQIQWLLHRDETEVRRDAIKGTSVPVIPCGLPDNKDGLKVDFFQDQYGHSGEIRVLKQFIRNLRLEAPTPTLFDEHVPDRVKLTSRWHASLGPRWVRMHAIEEARRVIVHIVLVFLQRRIYGTFGALTEFCPAMWR